MQSSNNFACNYFLSWQDWSTSKISQNNRYRPRQTWKITQLHVDSSVQGLNTVKRPQKTIIIQKKRKNKSSNHRRCTPTLQGRIKQNKTTRTKAARKHEQAELHPQGPKAQTPAKQTEPTTHEPTNQQEPPSQ
jgi:hypothetical protein